MTNDICILFRKSLAEEEEFLAATKYFNVVENRSDAYDLVIPRYSALPYYKELEYDIKNKDGELIQSYKSHKYIADFEYYEDIKDYTFKTWFLGDTNLPDIPVVVKGVTNSKKWNWNTR